jgi:hypothetical protein
VGVAAAAFRAIDMAESRVSLRGDITGERLISDKEAET